MCLCLRGNGEGSGCFMLNLAGLHILPLSGSGCIYVGGGGDGGGGGGWVGGRQ